MMPLPPPVPPLVRRQQGSSLLMSLVMLVVLTLIVVSVIRMSNTNLKISGNIQAAVETEAAAQQAIEGVLSSVDNFNTPAPKTTLIDVNNDGKNDYTVKTKAPECLQTTIAPGYSEEFADSAPKDTYWDVQADVTDDRTGATATLHQGVKVRMDSAATCS